MSCDLRAGVVSSTSDAQRGTIPALILLLMIGANL